MTSVYRKLSGDSSIQDLDDLYAKYGFFSDTDGDFKWESGEPIGAGNGIAAQMFHYQDDGTWKEYVLQPRLQRPQVPMDPNSFIEVNLHSTGGTLTESWVNVKVTNGSTTYVVR